MKKFLLCSLLALLAGSGTANADKLLCQDGATFKGNTGVTMTVSGEVLSLDLATDFDAAQIAAQLQGKLAEVKVSNPVGTNKLEFSGAPVDKMQAALVATDVEMVAALDPLAALSGLGGENNILMNGPEVGGSIRASNPMIIDQDFLMPTSDIKESKVEDRFTARVVSVEKGEFPEVILNIRVRQVNSRGARVVNNNAYRAKVLLPGLDGRPDLSLKSAQNNLAAYYLQANDKIEAHVLRKEHNTIYLDFVQRIP